MGDGEPRFEHQERGDYDLERFEEEFCARLYTDVGREIVARWERSVGAEKETNDGSKT